MLKGVLIVPVTNEASGVGAQNTRKTWSWLVLHSDNEMIKSHNEKKLQARDGHYLFNSPGFKLVIGCGAVGLIEELQLRVDRATSWAKTG